MHIEIFYWRSRGNVVHRGARIDGGPRLTAEGCNYDDASATEGQRLDEVAGHQGRECARCLPEEQIYGVPI